MTAYAQTSLFDQPDPLIVRAEALGFRAERSAAWGFDYVLLWQPDEDPATLLPLVVDDSPSGAAAFLDWWAWKQSGQAR